VDDLRIRRRRAGGHDGNAAIHRRLNGAPVPMVGVTAVGTLPHQRRGLLRIMAQGFGEMRDRGQAYAILWVSMGAICSASAMGWPAVRRFEFDPRMAARQAGPKPGGAVSTRRRTVQSPSSFTSSGRRRETSTSTAQRCWQSIHCGRAQGEPVPSPCTGMRMVTA
jgi:hypothetical protein